MANDISKSVSANPIKNGSVVSVYSKSRFYQQNNYVSNKPVIDDIQNKYDTRFSNITYYTIGNNNLLGA
jgi:hypothetical protein